MLCTMRWFVNLLIAGFGCVALSLGAQPGAARPNILLCISDDHSWVHASAYELSALVSTPTFDRVAKEGALFTGGFAAAPSCAPARATLLTGRNIWQNEEAGVHGSFFPAKYPIFTSMLRANGYHVGSTGKVWGPGKWNQGGPNVARTEDPRGGKKWPGQAAGFRKFLKQRKPGQPFFYWFGSTDPHRPYDRQARIKAWGERKVTADDVPPFLPDIPEIREDLADYGFEVERFDRQVGALLKVLKETGQDENTIVLITGDNGMPFPRAKRECYEYGTHVPLAVRWPARMPGGRVVDDLVSFVDFAPTFLAAAGVSVPDMMTGRSMLPTMTSEKSGLVDPARDWVLTGRERHNAARPGNTCYPERAIRTHEYLYIRNLEPDRWPVGPAPDYLDIGWYGYPEVLKGIVSGEEKNPELLRHFDIGTRKRPAEELFDIRTDPGCLVNLAEKPEHEDTCRELWTQLKEKLEAQGDPRMFGRGECFDSAPSIICYPPKIPGMPPKGKYAPGKMKFDHSQDRPWVYSKGPRAETVSPED